MKRSIHAAFAVAFVLSLFPLEFGGARPISAPHMGGMRKSTQHFLRTPDAGRSAAAAARKVSRKLKVSDARRPADHNGAAKSKKAKQAASKRVLSSSNPVIARRALQVAKKMNTVGWCYKGVCTALQPLGIHLSGGAAYEAKDQLLKDKRFQAFAISGLHDLKPGDILVHGASASHPYGHIAVYLGNRSEASDHVQQVVLNGPYSGTTVFRYAAKEPSLSMAN